MSVQRMKIIDPSTGEPPVLEDGDCFVLQCQMVDGSIIPDGITENGEPVIHLEVSRARGEHR